MNKQKEKMLPFKYFFAAFSPSKNEIVNSIYKKTIIQPKKILF